MRPKLKVVAEAIMWLPGFAPEDDPNAALGIPETSPEAEIIPIHQEIWAPAKAKAKTVWPILQNSVFIELQGNIAKFEANIAAIELLKQLEQDCREPTADERHILNRYTGWGGLPKAFNQDQKDPAWVARTERLKAKLTEAEHTSAEASTPNAHYTSLEVIEAIWALVQRLGFKGGRIIEPAAGVGYFLGAMPEQIAQNSRITAIELDDLSARILERLYGSYGVDVVQDGFENLRLPNEYFDLAIGNVPFGNYQVAEHRNVPYQNFLIHDYFIAKSLDLVRPGGLVVFVTSAGTLDKQDDRVRQYLGAKADLVAAIRLPNTAFRKIANTEVTTDIVILQKPLAGKTAKRGWMESVAVPNTSTIFGEPHWSSRAIFANRYFVDNPQWVIGKLKLCSNGYSTTTGCEYDGELTAALRERIAQIPAGIYTSVEEDVEQGNVVKLALTEHHRPGFRVIDGKVYEINGADAVLYQAPQKTLERIAGMIEIRDAARKLVKSQAATEDDTLLGTYRIALNVVYDAFLSRHGYIHAKANKSAFRLDPDLPLLLSLEQWDDETHTAEKSDIFFRRTVGATQRVERCETPQDALIASIVELGRIDENRIGALLGKPGNEAMRELEELRTVFHDPETGIWETADAYLSGNVRHKLTAAKVAGDRYHGNVAALETVIPTDLTPSEIGARIGSTWIPTKDYEAFLNEILDSVENLVSFSATAGAWHVDPDFRTHRSVAATQMYGTERANAVTLFEQALNQTAPTVTDQDPLDRSKRVVNQKETIAAREKQQLLREKFVEWLWQDDSRAQRLVRLYNDQFNSLVRRQYDGSHLDLPGFSQVYRLHKHQSDAIWRVVASGWNALLAHQVGAGKTLSMICAGMELRRLGKVSKPMYAVPNHMLEQFAAEFLRAYPGANILMAGKEDLQGDRRRALMSRIATGNWDGVLITHASFERLKMSDEFMEEYVLNEIELIKDAIRAEKRDRGNRIVKELARAKKAWEAKLAKLSGRTKKDDILTFEDLGVDWLFIDEAHCFPYETTVLTSDGWVSIGEVVQKRMATQVASVCLETGEIEWKAVTDWITSQIEEPLVRIEHDRGILECTADHEIWTYEEGYVEARNLRPDHHLRVLWEGGSSKDQWEARPEVLRSYLRKQCDWSSKSTTRRNDYKDMRAMQEGVLVSISGASERREAPIPLESLRGNMEEFEPRSSRTIQEVDCTTLGVLAREGESWRESKDVTEQSHEEPRCRSEDESSSSRANVSVTRRKWSAYEAASTPCGASRSPNGVRNQHQAGSRAVRVVAEELQGGPGGTSSQGCDRSGREQSQAEEVAVSGQAQNLGTKRSRVVGIEILEPRGSGKPGSCRGEGQAVYCLEVEGNNNFFASGVLVSNCFKNLWRFSKMTRIAGLPNSNSERAFDMFVKTRFVMEKHKGRAGVVFATGTPVSNSMAEMWVMQRYLQPKTLDAFQVGMFDTWAGNFGESVTALELAPDGSGYRMHTRFARFVNLPELMSMFGMVADIRTAEMLKLPVPKAYKETVTAKPTAELKAFVQTLVARAENIRNGHVSPAVDNMLAVTNDGRKAALDMRLIDSLSYDCEGSKVNLCVQKVHAVWRDTIAFRGTQVVFCDLSTPQSDGRFSVYRDLRHKLVEMDVPGAEIAFIHDYESDSAKEELFKAVRDGRIRILIGSTGKMGVGTNIQTRLAALHHLDAPWRPADVEQREGRIVRQGNLNEEVRIFRYVAEGSFDSYIWQTLETKARFVAQIMQGDTGMRSAEDIELAALSYAEVKALASGNPLVLEKAGVDTELAKLSLLKSQWDQQQWRNRHELSGLPSSIKQIQARIKCFEADVGMRRDVSGTRFSMEVDGVRYSDRNEAGDALLRSVQAVRLGEERAIGRIAGFRVVVKPPVIRDFGKRLLIVGNTEYEAGQAETPIGYVKVLENLLHRMDLMLNKEYEHLARTEKRMADIGAELAKSFDKADRLIWLQQRQREIEAALDLTKGEMAAVDEAEVSEVA